MITSNPGHRLGLQEPNVRGAGGRDGLRVDSMPMFATAQTVSAPRGKFNWLIPLRSEDHDWRGAGSFLVTGVQPCFTIFLPRIAMT